MFVCDSHINDFLHEYKLKEWLRQWKTYNRKEKERERGWKTVDVDDRNNN